MALRGVNLNWGTIMNLDELRKLAGLDHYAKGSKAVNWDKYPGSNISLTGAEKRKIERERNIRPGTDAWFKLWFSKPYLTGEKPVEDK